MYPSNTVQSSQDSTLTQVTSIMINDNNYPDHHYQIRNNNSIAIIDESHEPQQSTLHAIHRKRKVSILFLDDNNDHIDYSNDEILNILIRKRDELVIAFR
jgi:hypothetical protein